MQEKIWCACVFVCNALKINAIVFALITSGAVTARLAGVKAAQENLGHTTSATTEKHYLSQE